jgi:hypothetical protein
LGTTPFLQMSSLSPSYCNKLIVDLMLVAIILAAHWLLPSSTPQPQKLLLLSIATRNTHY